MTRCSQLVTHTELAVLAHSTYIPCTFHSPAFDSLENFSDDEDQQGDGRVRLHRSRSSSAVRGSPRHAAEHGAWVRTNRMGGISYGGGQPGPRGLQPRANPGPSGYSRPATNYETASAGATAAAPRAAVRAASTPGPDPATGAAPGRHRAETVQVAESQAT